MEKKSSEDETHQHAWCTHKEGEKGGYCDLMEGVHFSHFLTGECKGAEEEGAATCPAYPEEELEQVEEEIINWEEFLKTPTQQATPGKDTTLIITKDGHTVIDGEPSPSIAFPRDLPHGNCHCDTDNYEKNLLRADCTDIEGIHQEKNRAPGGGYLHPVEQPASWTYRATGKHLMHLRCLVDNSYVR